MYKHIASPNSDFSDSEHSNKHFRCAYRRRRDVGSEGRRSSRARLTSGFVEAKRGERINVEAAAGEASLGASPAGK